jgi:short-subunit dehydrogenase
VTLPDPAPDRTALVTGASSGIGAAIARRLAERGHALTLVARRSGRLAALAEELRPLHGRAIDVVVADLADAGERDRMARTVDEHGRAVTVLVNSAGHGLYADAVDNGVEREVGQVRLDVEAVVDLMGRYLPGMVRRGSGAVINLASTAGFQPLPHNAGYSAAKAFVLTYSEAVAMEVRRHGVTVVAVCPGPVPTEFQQVNQVDFGQRIPRLLWVDADRVAADALAGAAAGRRVVIPGGRRQQLAFAAARYAPAGITLRLTDRLMRR